MKKIISLLALIVLNSISGCGSSSNLPAATVVDNGSLVVSLQPLSGGGTHVGESVSYTFVVTYVPKGGGDGKETLFTTAISNTTILPGTLLIGSPYARIFGNGGVFMDNTPAIVLTAGPQVYTIQVSTAGLTTTQVINVPAGV